MRLLLAMIVVLLAPVMAGAVETITGRAMPLDGYTLRMGRDDVRMFGIDSPEMRTPLGLIARGAMDDIVAGQIVTCDVVNTDSNKRPVAVCTAGGTDLAEALVRQGLATVYRKYTTGSPLEETYNAAEAEARAAELGVWAPVGHTPGWFERYQNFVIGGFGFLGVWGTTWLGFWMARIGRHEEAEFDRYSNDRQSAEEVRTLAAALAAEFNAVGITMRNLLENYHRYHAGDTAGLPANQATATLFWLPALEVFKANADRLGILGPARAGFVVSDAYIAKIATHMFLGSIYRPDGTIGKDSINAGVLKEFVENIHENVATLRGIAGLREGE